MMVRKVKIKGTPPFRTITHPDNMVTIEESDIRRSSELEGFKRGIEWAEGYTLKLIETLNEKQKGDK